MVKNVERKHWIAGLVALLFFVLVVYLNNRHYLAYDLYGSDAAPFYQGMWNTLRGDIMFTTLNDDRSVLSYHFTPYFILLSPLLLIWEDIRILMAVQALGFALAGFIFYLIVYRKHPTLALWFLPIYYLNATMHQLAHHELRRVPFAVPWLALALFGLSEKRRKLMLAGLFFALLCKEDVSVVVFMVGIFLLVVERDWRWGVPIAGLGLGWAVIVTQIVMPALGPADQIGYSGLSEFAQFGSSPTEIAITLIRNPGQTLGYAFDGVARSALWRLFLPLGLFLPLLAPRWLLIGLPSLGLLLLSSNEALHGLERWYLSAILPVFFAAVAVGIGRQPEKRARLLLGWGVVCTVIGFLLFSLFPLGGLSDFGRYTRTPHHDFADRVLTLVPADEVIATQTGYQPHLANRPRLYTYPWFGSDQEAGIEWYLLDRKANPYPLGELEIGSAIDNLVSDPNNVLVAEADGLALIGVGAEQNVGVDVGISAESSIHLERIELAVTDESGWYDTTVETPLVVQAGQTIRVAIYWRAIAEPVGNRTVSLRVADGATGVLIAQHDMQPGNGARPTIWWETGWFFRDTYYLTIADGAQSGDGSIDILLYDSETQARVPFDNGQDVISLWNVTVR